MKVAALYDVHGNLPALDAVLEEIAALNVDRIVIGGDVLPGPMMRETLSRLLALDVPTDCISGNGEREVLACVKGRVSTSIPEQAREIVRWTAEHLPEEHRQWIETWPQTLRLEIAGAGSVLFCHATPRSDTEIFTRLTPDERLAPIFDGADASIVVCGHTHMQFDRTIGATRIVNAGSVGMPFGKAGACWLLLGPKIELRRTEYDLRKAADVIRATDYPQAEHFAAHNVIEPPTESGMLDLFTRA